MNYSEIRSNIIKRRQLLLPEVRKCAEAEIMEQFFSLAEYQKADIILVYCSYNGEVSTREIIERAFEEGKLVYVPICREDYSLDFYRITSFEDLKSGHYGILEPLANEDCKLTHSVNLANSICITPGLVFDGELNRIGYGKGYYDRFFAEYNIPHRIALAFDFQITDHIECKSTDIKMTNIISNINGVNS